MMTIIASATLAAMAAQSEPETIQLNASVYAAPRLEISRVQMIDNVDQGDIFGANRADLYALVTVNGIKYKTEIEAKDNAKPRWQIPLDMSQRYNKISIRLMDEDGGFERNDDHIDISPLPKHKDLCFTYDRVTNTMDGEVSGHAGSELKFVGKGDDDRAEIYFKVLDY